MSAVIRVVASVRSRDRGVLSCCVRGGFRVVIQAVRRGSGVVRGGGGIVLGRLRHVLGCRRYGEIGVGEMDKFGLGW